MIFKHIYEAEPLDFWNGIIPFYEYLENREFVFTDAERLELLQKKIHIEKFIAKQKEDLRREICVFPTISGCSTSIVFVAKIDNNGTTFYFSDCPLWFANTNMEEIEVKE